MNGMVNARLICMMALLIGMTACEQYTEPTPVERESVTFDGRLERAGVFVGTFPVKNAGAVRVLLNSLVGADTNITAVGGLAVGTWNGSTCSLVVKNENATFSTVVSGSAVVGDYCVQLYDVGKFSEAVNYSMEVQHP
ncbi:MAG: hypothetical protein ACRD1Q_00705 [Vicinamibacterales bacterium]